MASLPVPVGGRVQAREKGKRGKDRQTGAALQSSCQTPASCLLLLVKCPWNKATFVCLQTVYGCFHTAAELSDVIETLRPTKPKTSIFLPFTGKVCQLWVRNM